MKLAEVHLETHKLEALKAFYTQTLQLPLVHEDKNSFAVRIGASKLYFSHATGDDEPFYHFAINIPENQLAEAKAWLATRVSLIEKEGTDEFYHEDWNAHALYFRDPAGNLVEFIARHNLDNASQEPFSSESLLCISEIGIAVEEVRIFSEHVKQELNVQVWRGDEKNFAAIGDEEGLFIIVPVGRPWFPDDRPAREFPVVVDVGDQ